MIEVRATVNLPGLKRGEIVWVEPDNPYVRSCLEARLLVAIETEETEALIESEGTP